MWNNLVAERSQLKYVHNCGAHDSKAMRLKDWLVRITGASSESSKDVLCILRSKPGASRRFASLPKAVRINLLVCENTSPPGRHTLLSDFAAMLSHTIYGLWDRTIPLCARGTLEEVGLSAEVE
jgi:hypothetical protein